MTKSIPHDQSKAPHGGGFIDRSGHYGWAYAPKELLAHLQGLVMSVGK
jgi:hypothetical protein